MPFKKVKQLVEFIYQTECDGEFKHKLIYDPKSKTYFTFSKSDLQNKFDEELSHGSNHHKFCILIATNLTAKKMWKDLVLTLIPKFKTDDFVVFSKENDGAAFTLKSVVWQAKEISYWKRVCGWQDKEVKYMAYREFVRVDGTEKIISNEKNAVLAEKIEKLKIANPVINKIKKQFKDAGIEHATLNYMGKAYRI